MKKLIFTTALLIASSLTVNAQLKITADNVDEIVKAMTLEEKATLVVGTSRQGSTGGNQSGNGMVGAQELKSFAKTRELKPRESQTLTMKLTAYDLASFNESTQCWETASGKYTFKFGANVEDIRANATVNISRPSKVQCHDVMKPSMELK